MQVDARVDSSPPPPAAPFAFNGIRVGSEDPSAAATPPAFASFAFKAPSGGSAPNPFPPILPKAPAVSPSVQLGASASAAHPPAAATPSPFGSASQASFQFGASASAHPPAAATAPAFTFGASSAVKAPPSAASFTLGASSPPAVTPPAAPSPAAASSASPGSSTRQQASGSSARTDNPPRAQAAPSRSTPVGAIHTFQLAGDHVFLPPSSFSNHRNPRLRICRRGGGLRV
jgi:hypothetical protein